MIAAGRLLTIGAVLAAMATNVAASAQPRPAGAPAKPMRIMSMNICTDLLVLQLAPKSRIASVSYLAHDAANTVEPGLDKGVAANHGAAEDVLLESPDLILTGSFSPPATQRLARQVGARLVLVDQAENFEQIRAVTRQIGQAVGEPGRAEALIARMDAKLAQLKASAAPPIRVVAWDGGKTVPGKGTLTNAIIEAAGAVNIGATLPDATYGRYDLEELIRDRPAALLQGISSWGGPSLQDDSSANRVVRTLYRGRRITYPEMLYGCGLPQSADAAIVLRDALRRLPKQGWAY